MEENIWESLSHLNLTEEVLAKLVNYAMDFTRNVILALIVYTIGSFVVRKLTAIVRKIMTRRKVEPSLYSFVDSLCTIVLYFILVIAVVSILGIETSSFVALFASAGVAIGMALSGTLQNFAGGVMILIFRPYKVGDFIEAQGYAGTVKQIQIFNTILNTPDNQTIIIPNGGLSTGNIKNFSTAAQRRVDINIEVAYGTHPDAVRKVLNEVIAADARILKEGAFAPAIPMTSMASSSIVFQMRLWVESANYWAVLFDTTEAAYNALNSAGIEIPFQQVDVHMK